MYDWNVYSNALTGNGTSKFGIITTLIDHLMTKNYLWDNNNISYQLVMESNRAVWIRATNIASPMPFYFRFMNILRYFWKVQCRVAMETWESVPPPNVFQN